MNLKRTLGVVALVCVTATAVFTYKTNFAAVAAKPEAALKADLFSAQYEKLAPDSWFTVSKLNDGLTRKDAAYLAVYALSEASGTSPDWLNYSTVLSDVKDPMLSRAVDYGLMSVDQNFKFNSTKLMSQQEYAVVMTKVLRGLNLYQKPTKPLTYKDSTKVASWAKESVQYVTQNGYLPWISNNQFEPAKTITLGRAIAMTNQMLVKQGVYPKGGLSVLTESQQFTVNGYKMPKPIRSLTEWEMSVNAEDQLQLDYSGVIKDRGVFSNKTIVQQLMVIAASKEAFSYAAQASLTAVLRDAYDPTTQNYVFEKDQYIRLDNGQLTAVKPASAHVKVSSGSGIHLVFVD